MAETKTNTKGRGTTQIHTWCEFSEKAGDKNKSRFPAKKVVKTSANHQSKSQFPWKQTKSNFDGQTSVFCSSLLFPMSLARTFCAISSPPHLNINSLLWYKLGCLKLIGHQYAQCSLCLISSAEDWISGPLVIFHISGTLVIASQRLLLNCLLMFTDVCPQVVLFSPFTDSIKNTFTTQRLQWNLVDVAILVFRQPTDHIAGLQQGLMRLSTWWSWYACV